MLGDDSKNGITVTEQCVEALGRAAECLVEGEIITIAQFLIKVELDAVVLPDTLQFLDTRFFLQKVRGYTESRVAKKERQAGATGAIYAFREMLAQLVAATPNDRVYISGKSAAQKEATTNAPEADATTSGRVLHFVALDIERHVAKVVEDARTTVFLGGTMEPKAEFLAVARDALTFSAPHIVPAEHTLCRICTHGPGNVQMDLRAESRNRPEMLRELRNLISDAFAALPRGGCVVFFSSFAFLSKVREGVTVQRTSLFAEERGGSPSELLTSFSSTIESANKALLFAVVGGKVSEGINFKDDMCRLVLVCGLPYPNPQDPVLMEKMRFLDKGTGLTGKQFYSAKCMKGVNQSIGRAIRHRNDWAALLLIDHRYAQQHVLAGISAWLRDRMVARQFPALVSELRQFFEKRMSS